jgi:hypothetical protein
MNTQATAPFIPPAGELLRDTEGNAIMRVQPMVTHQSSGNYWTCYILVKTRNPEDASPDDWTTQVIGFLEVDGLAMETPTYLLLTRSDLYRECKFETHGLPDENNPVTLTLGVQTTQIVLDDRSSTIVRYLIEVCHDVTMCRS